MVVATNVPGLVYTDRGYVVPSEQAVLTGVQTDIDEAFGGGVNPSLTTPQGQIASSTAAIIANTNDQVVNLFSQFDPAYNSGRAQDAIARIYFISRNPAQPTVVEALCTGGQGVVIPAGALAKATDGKIYVCTDGTDPITGIPIGGQVTLTFACAEDGPIACPAGTLTTIYSAINGWDSITNVADGVLGNEVESRIAFELRRQASVALNARSSLTAVQGAVLNIADVLDAYVTENTTAAPIVVRGVTIDPKSLYVAAVGGTDAAVAQAIWSKKAPGCAYNGNTTVTVEDTNGSYSPPYPSYQVSFERPDALPIFFKVVIQNSLQVPANASDQIAAAIMSAFAGADGGTRARIGSTIFSSRYYGAVAALGSWANIISLQVASSNGTLATFTGAIAGTTLTVSSVTGTIAIGQVVYATVTPFSVTPVYIVSGAGTTWTISGFSGTVSSRAMASFSIDDNFVDVRADQVPTISAANIVVSTT